MGLLGVQEKATKAEQAGALTWGLHWNKGLSYIHLDSDWQRAHSNELKAPRGEFIGTDGNQESSFVGWAKHQGSLVIGGQECAAKQAGQPPASALP